MVAALIVKEDGLIYAVEVPEEPEYNGEIGHSINVQKLYYGQLDVAKSNSVLVSDQEKAKALIWQYGDQHNKPIVKPGLIVPIPDLQWTVKEQPIEREASTFTHYEREAGKQLVTEFTKVAILL